MAISEQDQKRCPVCETFKPFSEFHRASATNLHIDHIKGTKIVRGVLCFMCNSGIGKFGHDPDRMEQVAGWLRHRHEELGWR